jgi:(R,R)-butanediol dehydrogenase/meso-butanediol dehydrogenase/diacetyl reductase
MSNTKKGVVLIGAKQITIEERPLPKPGPGEGIVKVELCGICGSDLHGWEAGGAVYPLGTLMGHEAVGTVTDVGEGISALKTGDKVAINGFSSCGYCVACRRGLNNACVNNLDRTIGNSDKLDGAFADYIWLPELGIMATQMPENLSFEDGALTEPLATSVHAVRISQFQVGDTVVVAGAGPIGLLAIQALKVGGAGRIIVSQSPGPRRDLALELGADEAVNPRDPDNPVGDQTQQVTDGGADVVIECAGVPASFQQCIDMARPGGQVILVGVNEKETPVIPMKLMLGEIQLKGSLAWSHHDFKIAVDMLAGGKIETQPLLSDTISMADIEELGFKRLKTDKSLIKLLVKP